MDQNQYQSYQPYESAPPVKNAAYYRARARQALKSCYGYAILAFLLASLLGGVASGGSFSISLPSGSIETMPGDAQLEALANGVMEAWAAGGILAIFSEYPLFWIIFIIFGVVLLLGLLFALFVSSPVKVGYRRYNLGVIDGQGKTLTVIFDYFKKSYGKTIWLSILRSLITFACELPALVGGVGLIVEASKIIIKSLAEVATDKDAISLLLWVLLFCVGAIISAVLSVWVQYRYAYAEMILAEYPELSAMDALRNSASLMKGNKWRLFCLNFSFIGWGLLAAFCTCGIGMLFLIPYSEAAKAAFYDDIANRAAAREAEFPSLDPNDYDPNSNF